MVIVVAVVRAVVRAVVIDVVVVHCRSVIYRRSSSSRLLSLVVGVLLIVALTELDSVSQKGVSALLSLEFTCLLFELLLEMVNSHQCFHVLDPTTRNSLTCLWRFAS